MDMKNSDRVSEELRRQENDDKKHTKNKTKNIHENFSKNNSFQISKQINRLGYKKYYIIRYKKNIYIDLFIKNRQKIFKNNQTKMSIKMDLKSLKQDSQMNFQFILKEEDLNQKINFFQDVQNTKYGREEQLEQRCKKIGEMVKRIFDRQYSSSRTSYEKSLLKNIEQNKTTFMKFEQDYYLKDEQEQENQFLVVPAIKYQNYNFEHSNIQQQKEDEQIKVENKNSEEIQTQYQFSKEEKLFFTISGQIGQRKIENTKQNKCKNSSEYSLALKDMKFTLGDFLFNINFQDNTLNKFSKEHSPKGKQYKNFLVTIKRCIIRMYKSQLQTLSAQIPFIHRFLNQTSKTNIKQFNQLFALQIPQIKQMLIQIFSSNRLQRQIQISRITKNSRILFMRKIDVLKKGFIEGRLNSL